MASGDDKIIRHDAKAAAQRAREFEQKQRDKGDMVPSVRNLKPGARVRGTK